MLDHEFKQLFNFSKIGVSRSVQGAFLYLLSLQAEGAETRVK